MVRFTMMLFDGNENRQVAVRFIDVGKIDADDDVNDDNEDATNGNNVCMHCKLDKCVNAQRAIRCTYERNVWEKCLRSNNQKLFSVKKIAVDKFLQENGVKQIWRKKKIK